MQLRQRADGIADDNRAVIEYLLEFRRGFRPALRIQVRQAAHVDRVQRTDKPRSYRGWDAQLVGSGTFQQLGQLYRIPTASYACSDGLSTTAAVEEIKATTFGIEGRFSAPSVGGGCREDATFSAVFLPPL